VCVILSTGLTETNDPLQKRFHHFLSGLKEFMHCLTSHCFPTWSRPNTLRHVGVSRKRIGKTRFRGDTILGNNASLAKGPVNTRQEGKVFSMWSAPRLFARQHALCRRAVFSVVHGPCGLVE
jgi:hypothetical protein